MSHRKNLLVPKSGVVPPSGYFPWFLIGLMVFAVAWAKAQSKGWIRYPHPYSPVAMEEGRLLQTERPRNLILFIGDGMGLAHITAAHTANRGRLNLEAFRYVGLSQTQAADRYVTDSGAAATAIASGVKTYNGAIGVGPDSQAVTTLIEWAEARGLSTGLVVTSSVTHATPAAFVAHQKNRTQDEAIAEDFLHVSLDLFIGGGRRFFTDRSDGRDLVEELKAKGYAIYASLESVDTLQTGPVAVFTAEEHDLPAPQRGDRLPKAVAIATRILSRNPKGFFLMVEGSQIDWGAHRQDTERILFEILDFDRAIGEALRFAAREGNTLLVVTSDHETGGMAIADGSVEEGKVLAHFTTKEHTGVMVPVFAVGPQAERFAGLYPNTELFFRMREAFGP